MATPRHRPTQAELLARLPRAFRPELTPAQQWNLTMCHHVNLDAVHTGQAEPGILWDWVGCALVWWKVAELLGAGELEMQSQLEMATRMVERFARTGYVLFDEHDYQAARIGVQIMDALASLVDQRTAEIAVGWSEVETNRRAAGVQTAKIERAAA